MGMTKILEISLICSIVIVIAGMICGIQKNKYQAKYIKLVWLLLAVRLLIPINPILLSGVSPLEIPTIKYSEEMKAAQEDIKAGSTVPEIDLEKQQNTLSDRKNSTSERKDRTLDAGRIMTGIWCLGVILYAAYYIGSYFVFLRKMQRWSVPCDKTRLNHILQQIANELGVKNIPQIRIWENSERAPFIMGIMRPCLVLPEDHYNEKDFYLIAKHEMVHYQKKDILYKLVLLGANAVHWFNPLVWLMNHWADKSMELSCDETVVEDSSFVERKEYCEVIMSCISKERKMYPVLSTGWVSNTRFLKVRFSNALEEKRKRKGTFLVVIAVILLILLGTVIHVIEVEQEIEKENIPIAYGHEVRTDIDGNGKEDCILVTDNVSGNRAFTQVTATMDNGDTIFKDYEGNFSSSIVTGDLSGNGKADVLLVRYDTGSTYGAAEVSVLYFDNGVWEEYSREFISNPEIKMEQPKNFSPENWMEVSILDAAIAEKDGKTMLLLTVNEDIQNNIVKVINASYCEGRWYIEDMQRKTASDDRAAGEAYTDEELIQLAKEYYVAHTENGKTPEFAEVTEAADGMVNIQLYDVIEDHGVTRNWYTVDRVTATGYDTNFNDVNLVMYENKE